MGLEPKIEIFSIRQSYDPFGFAGYQVYPLPEGTEDYRELQGWEAGRLDREADFSGFYCWDPDGSYQDFLFDSTDPERPGSLVIPLTIPEAGSELGYRKAAQILAQERPGEDLIVTIR